MIPSDRLGIEPSMTAPTNGILAKSESPSQLLFRSLRKKRDGRMVWLKTGRDALFDILQEHLPKVGGLGPVSIGKKS